MAVFAISFPSLLVAGFWSLGLTINTTASMPVGIWKVHHIPIGTSIPRGSVVLFCPPDTPLFRTAKKEGILQEGPCEGSYLPLMKEVVGVPGDVVEYTGSFRVNGREVPDSGVLKTELQSATWEFDTPLLVPEGKMLLIGSSSKLSFDSRYFGLVNRLDVTGIGTQILSLKL